MTFGVSGKLWRDSLVMYDRTTRSLWSQVLGKAIAGPLKGVSLQEIPSEQTTWVAWKKRHPETLVLEKPSLSGSGYAAYFRNPDVIGVVGSENPDPRLGVKALVYGMQRDERHAAVPFFVLEKRPVLNTTALGAPIVVMSPKGETAAAAFERTIDGATLTFERVPSTERLTVSDTNTGSTWSWDTGECVRGKMEGRKLLRIQGLAVYWGVWARFHPKTELIERQE